MAQVRDEHVETLPKQTDGRRPGAVVSPPSLEFAVAVTALAEALDAVRAVLNTIAKSAAAGTRSGARS